MSKTKHKKVLNLRVASAEKGLELMRALGELEADVAAEVHPGGVEVEVYGSTERIRELEREITNLVKRSG